MPGLTEVVRGLAARDGVDAVVVVSPDGLPIAHASRGARDIDALSALTTTLLRPAGRLGESIGHGALGRVVLEYDGGIAIIATLGDGNALAVLTAAGADVGALLYDLRRHAPAFKSVL